MNILCYVIAMTIQSMSIKLPRCVGNNIADLTQLHFNIIYIYIYKNKKKRNIYIRI